jgi:glyoxylase-like metal-dependent hydrolase (beta-lactamase superfamily II)
MRKLLAILPLVCGCLVAHQEPAVRGLPPDDRAAPLSAVWVGHATVLLRIGNRTVLTDPNLSGAILVLPRETPASLRPSELPRIDVALISHMHMDHFDAPTLRKLGPDTAVFFPDGGQGYAGAAAMVPIHFEAYYSRGTEHGAPRRRLLAEVARRGLGDRVFALHTGERIALGDGAPKILGEEGPVVAGR